jgi:hypothetical protein
VEAKGKSESDFWLSLRTEAYSTGLAAESRPIEASSSVAEIIKGAYEQLQATPASDGAFRILWVLAAHNDAAFVLTAFEKRLFGLEEVSAVKLPASLESLPEVRACYYYGHSDFPRYVDLDGAVLATNSAALLCVNSFSKRRQSFRTSQLHSLFKELNAIEDPEVEERENSALIIDEAVIGARGSGRFSRRSTGWEPVS